jgi:hypothetical protein
MSAMERKALPMLKPNGGAGYSDCQSLLVMVLVILKQ